MTTDDIRRRIERDVYDKPLAAILTHIVDAMTARLDDLAIRDGETRAKVHGYEEAAMRAPTPPADLIPRAAVLDILDRVESRADVGEEVLTVQTIRGMVMKLHAAPPAPDAAAIYAGEEEIAQALYQGDDIAFGAGKQKPNALAVKTARHLAVALHGRTITRKGASHV